jgi:hypothetical protein
VDDAAKTERIVSLISGQPTCLDCLAARSGITPRDAARTIERIASSLRFAAQATGLCRLCGRTVGPVYSLARPE